MSENIGWLLIGMFIGILIGIVLMLLAFMAIFPTFMDCVYKEGFRWFKKWFELPQSSFLFLYMSMLFGGERMLLEQPKMSLRRSYANGYKYCSRCRAYYLTDSVRCPYCGILLRNSPRKKKAIEKNVKYVRVPPEILEEVAEVATKTA